MDEVTVNEECYTKKKPLIEEIGELKIEESLKERILEKIANLEKNNQTLADAIDGYYRSTRRLERTIVRLAAMMADGDESIVEDRVLHTY